MLEVRVCDMSPPLLEAPAKSVHSPLLCRQTGPGATVYPLAKSVAEAVLDQRRLECRANLFAREAQVPALLHQFDRNVFAVVLDHADCICPDGPLDLERVLGGV